MWHDSFILRLGPALAKAIRSAGVVDLFDIGVVTLLIYLCICWIRRARAIRVIQGALVMVAAYGVATQIGLTLTTSLFRSVSTLMMVTLMSLFQEDVRRFFERMTVHTPAMPEEQTLRALHRAIARFAEKRVGALIVLKGRDPLDRHVDGGQPLGGLVSSALLDSLFDPHSDGHDGAVIIEGDRVTRFGVHLPLSRRLEGDTGFGTRHAAALGLAEACDALCIAVSEQRGTVSIARDGQLAPVKTGRPLEDRLRDFVVMTAPPLQTDAPVVAFFRYRSWEKVFSLVFGLLLWFAFVKGVRPAEKTLETTVRLEQLPPGVVAAAVVPSRAIVTLRGWEQDLRDLKANEVSVVLGVPADQRWPARHSLSAEMVRRPAAFDVVHVSPGQVHLLVQRKARPAAVLPAKTGRSWFSFGRSK